ncbi:uncharacterized protein [Diadema antillarum]|uniref:uncharacterized protein n=1 Tax=Diadema antillarum TaxID=105358 RepID=UPI003A83BB61
MTPMSSAGCSGLAARPRHFSRHISARGAGRSGWTMSSALAARVTSTSVRTMDLARTIAFMGRTLASFVMGDTQHQAIIIVIHGNINVTTASAYQTPGNVMISLTVPMVATKTTVEDTQHQSTAAAIHSSAPMGSVFHIRGDATDGMIAPITVTNMDAVEVITHLHQPLPVITGTSYVPTDNVYQATGNVMGSMTVPITVTNITTAHRHTQIQCLTTEVATALDVTVSEVTAVHQTVTAMRRVSGSTTAATIIATIALILD